jgi:hypothetical protein
MTESKRDPEETGLADCPVSLDFPSVKLGMSKDDVLKLLGVPDKTREIPFGGEILTAWVYATQAKSVQIWFDASGKLRLCNRQARRNSAS